VREDRSWVESWRLAGPTWAERYSFWNTKRMRGGRGEKAENKNKKKTQIRKRKKDKGALRQRRGGLKISTTQVLRK